MAIAAGGHHNLVLKSNGTVVAWGWNYYGQSTVPVDLQGVVAIAAGEAHSMALKSNGTVVVWGDNLYGESTVPAGLTGVTAIAAGRDHILALKRTGFLFNALNFSTNGWFRFDNEGIYGRTGTIEISTNLKDWLPMTNFIGSNTPINFLDSSGANLHRRFYRAWTP